MSDCNISDRLESEYFNFSSTEFNEDFCELAEETIQTALKKLQEILIAKFPSDRNEITNEITQLMEFFLVKSKGSLQKFKATVKEIFALPPNIVLPCYEEYELVTSEEVEQLQKEVDALEQEYIKEKYRHGLLKTEIKKFDQIEPLYQKTNAVLQSHKKTGDKSTQELYGTLNKFVDMYFTKIASGSSKTKEEEEAIDDEFGLFKVE